MTVRGLNTQEVWAEQQKTLGWVHLRFVRFANFVITSQSRHRSSNGLLIKNKFPSLVGYAALALPAHTSDLLLARPTLSIMNSKVSSATRGMSDPIF